MLTTEHDTAIDTSKAEDIDPTTTQHAQADDDKETSRGILDNGIASGHSTEPDESDQHASLQRLIEKQHADLTDHLTAWQEANPDKAHDIDTLCRIGNQYIGSRVLGGDWVFAANRPGNTQNPGAGQATQGEQNAGQVTQGEQDAGQPVADSPSASGQQPPNTTGDSAIKRFNGLMLASGINTNPEKGSQEEALVNNFRNGLRKEIADAEAKKGAPLTADEEYNLTMGYASKVLFDNHNDAMNRLDEELKKRGINPAPKEESAAAKKLAKSRAGLAREIADARLIKGAPLTLDEVQNITTEYAGWALPVKAHSVQVNGITIHFESGVSTAQHISNYSLSVVSDLARKSGLKEVWVTSTERKPADQARIMYENWEQGRSRGLYGPYGDQVEEVYRSGKELKLTRREIIDNMRKKIEEVGPVNVSHHLGDFNKLNVLDISHSPSKIAGGEGEINHRKKETVFIANALSDSRITKYNGPPRDPALHLEIKQPGQH
jgi:hypothetical protein